MFHVVLMIIIASYNRRQLGEVLYTYNMVSRSTFEGLFPKGIKPVLLLPMLSFGLLALPTMFRGLGWLILIALIPFCYFVTHCASYPTKHIKRAIYWPGFIYGLSVFAWELQTTPSRWTTLGGTLAIFSKIFVWLLCASIVSIEFWMLGIFVSKFRHRLSALLVGLPAMWALSEFLRTFFFSVITYGPGGSFSPNWNLGLIGMSLMSTPLAYISRFTGMYGMSVIAVLINIALFQIIQRRHSLLSSGVLLFVLTGSMLGYKLYQPNGNYVATSAVHLAPSDSLDNWAPVDLPGRNTQLLVAPEYSLFFDNPDYQTFAANNFGGRTVLVTSLGSSSKPPNNILTYYKPDRGLFNQQAKTFLVTGGEYMPYILSVLYKTINQEYLIKTFNETQQVRKGVTPEYVVDIDGLKTGGLVCSGVLALNEYRRLSKNGAEILTNSASLAVITGASLYHTQESYLTRFHSIANARPFIQASRSGESYIIDSNGSKLVASSGQSKLISAVVRTSKKRTLYSMLGEWSLIASILLLTLLYARSFKRV